ncbi:hypothetical protein E8E13_009941 [Curvularia kusanoi]|uniref:Uncharacterized protein n=1 Tax=Curvularia kusanoi TaxID=90978 RepID=A0A9P4TEI4_CURKU|nr:hypothetical protein E8E13_009941 [Curvularia kusanoi]
MAQRSRQRLSDSRDTLLVALDNFTRRQRRTGSTDRGFLIRLQEAIADDIVAVDDPSFRAVIQGPMLTELVGRNREQRNLKKPPCAQPQQSKQRRQHKLHKRNDQSAFRNAKKLEPRRPGKQPRHEPSQAIRTPALTKGQTPKPSHDGSDADGADMSDSYAGDAEDAEMSDSYANGVDEAEIHDLGPDHPDDLNTDDHNSHDASGSGCSRISRASLSGLLAGRTTILDTSAELS